MNDQRNSRPAEPAHETARATAGAVIVALAVLPAAGSLAVAVAAAQDPAPMARVLITAVVYAPVAAIALAHRRMDIAALTGALAVSSGWLALLVLVRGAFPDAAAIAVASETVAHVSRITEFAALGVLGWLVLRDRAHPYRAGVAFGFISPTLGAAYSIVVPFTPPPQWLIALPFALAVMSLVGAALAAAWRWRAGDARDRAAWSWFFVGVILTALSYGRILVPLPDPLRMVNDAAFVCAQGCLPIAILTIVITAPPGRLTVEAIAVAQSLAFGVGVYLAVTGLARALGAEMHVAGAVAAAAMALVFGATAASSRVRLTRLLSGQAPDAREVLGHLGERLDDSPGDGVGEIAASLRDTWSVASVEITLNGGEHPVRVGSPASEVISAELRSGGQAIGTITLASDDLPTLDQIQPVLDQTAGLIAAAVLLAAVNEEVAATRRRTLDVRREERRMLHEELHDSLAPALAGIGFGLAAAETLLTKSDPRWLPALLELREETSTSMDAVRRLARALLPTALDQGDLEGALSELGATLSAEGLHVEFDAHGTDVLDVDVQLSLYLLLAEVLSHARRATGLLAVTVKVTPSDDAVRVALCVDSFSDEVVDRVATLVRHRADELGARAVRMREHVIEAEFRR